jgi:aldehyde dehydrogenase (NAD+)
MRAAAENLTPVTLELGGKSPVIVATDADVRLAARRIVFGKFLNAGQTCIAPDYVLVAEPNEKAFLAMLAREIEAQNGKDPLHSPDLAQIVSDRHVNRLMGLLDSGRIACGGQVDRANRRIAPTILTDVAEDAPIMQSEIFGPILPVLPFSPMEEAIARVRARPAPLALYLFTAEKAAARRVMGDLAFGGGCVNDCIMHLTNLRMPFGGVGESGMGAYHGRAGFDCFTREKSVLTASARVDVPIRYAPRKGKLKLFRGASKQK